jgi:formate hydrogenlyase subunit 6/NADH:ubiquinone oxidoreductase subunit I
MEHTEIDLTRCLFRYQNTACSKCEELCPQQAIAVRKIDMERCNSCGLCTAVCPTGAIKTCCSYEEKLARCMEKNEVLMVCEKAVYSSGFSCLGFLDRHMLWAMAASHDVCLDISNCAACNAKIYTWLSGEIAACNAVLCQASRREVRCVVAKEMPSEEAKVSRRDFFRQLFGAAVETVEVIAKPEKKGPLEIFDEAQWIKRKTTDSCSLFPGLMLTGSCNACGMCGMICPEKAVSVEETEKDIIWRFSSLACKACGLCIVHCPNHALEFAPGDTRNETLRIDFPHCSQCGKPFKPIGDSTVCMECHQQANGL